MEITGLWHGSSLVENFGKTFYLNCFAFLFSSVHKDPTTKKLQVGSVVLKVSSQVWCAEDDNLQLFFWKKQTNKQTKYVLRGKLALLLRNPLSSGSNSRIPNTFSGVDVISNPDVTV